MSADGEFGVYLHIPFCSRRCDYCAFATWTDRSHLIEDYLAACRAEVAAVRAAGQLPRPTSVFVGGGTPSLVPGELLAGVIEAIEPLPGAEVTVECNPESLTAEFLSRLAGAGLNRVSLGVQSLVPHVLAGLGRHQPPGSVHRAVRLLAEAGIAYNVDLVYGGAGERDEDLLATLGAVLAFDPPPSHLSCYALTVEPGTPLWRDPARHPDDDVLARRYELIDERLAAAGYPWYEISNWARPGHECRHNRLYWHGGDYRGIGCAAHSHQDGRRFWNLRRPERYIAVVTAGRSPQAGGERLAPPEAEFEALALALRTREGVPASSLPADPALAGLCEDHGGRVTLTRRGRLLANEVSLRLKPARP